jgi:short-subunit dehydrogenase
MKDFKDKVIYIVGGSSGIGLAAGKLFAREGAHVVIFARRKEVLEQAVQEITAAAVSKAQRIAGLPLDVGDYRQVDETLNKAMEQFGIPDVLVNCAGTSHPGCFEAVPYEHFDDTMKVNVYGVWNATSVLAPPMKKRGGHIVNVSSVAGYIGLFGSTAYRASKFAVIGFSEALRSELNASGIQVSVFCPPDTDTPLFHEANKTKPPETKEISKKAKLMQPEDVAASLIAGMRKGQFMIIPGFDGKWIYLAKRLFPSLVDFLIDGAIKKARRH